MDVWLPDMNKHQVEYNDQLYEKVTESVKQELAMHDSATVEKQRDELTINMLKEKKNASAIV